MIDRRRALVIVAIVLAALALAWTIRFGCDDAFISFTYARNLVRGDGLTWFGNHVEGYTNFAWVLWIAAGLTLGFEPLVWAWIGSLACLAIAIVFTYRTARLYTPSSFVVGACVAGLLATNFTFLAFATSGLETMLQCALLVLAVFEVERFRRASSASRWPLLRISLLATAALWTRLDSAVPLFVIAMFLLRHLRQLRAPVVAYATVLGPALVLVGGWLAWKLVYYGDIVPNTFHAKVGISGATLAASSRFAFLFLHSYLLWPVLLAVVVIAAWRRVWPPRLPLAIVITWFAYVIVVGGDFMEFRFFVPVLPALFTIIASVLVAETAHARVPTPALRAGALVAILASVSWRHATTFDGDPQRFYDSVPRLGTFYGAVPAGDWGRLGRPLRDVLGGTNATLATYGAGAIPYYADLPTIDQLGLNDRWIARHGVHPGISRPGHQRFAPLEYLVERKVTFVIGTPTVVRRGELSLPTPSKNLEGWLRSLLGVIPNAPPRLLIVAVPLDDRDSMLMWYLTPSDAMTERIRRAGWEIKVLTRSP